MSFPERPGSQICFCSLDRLNLDSWQETAEKFLFLSGWAGNTFRSNSDHNCFSTTCLPTAHTKLDLLQAVCSKPGQVKMANCLGLQTTYTASNVASRLQYSPTLLVPLLVTTCLSCPLRLLLPSFLLGKACLVVLMKARGLRHSLALAISPALLLCRPWQSPRHSSPRVLKQALMIQDSFLLARRKWASSLFSPILPPAFSLPFCFLPLTFCSETLLNHPIAMMIKAKGSSNLSEEFPVPTCAFL